MWLLRFSGSTACFLWCLCAFLTLKRYLRKQYDWCSERECGYIWFPFSRRQFDKVSTVTLLSIRKCLEEGNLSHISSEERMVFPSAAEQSLRILSSIFPCEPCGEPRQPSFSLHSCPLKCLLPESEGNQYPDDQRFLCSSVPQCVFCLGSIVFSDEFHPSLSPLWLTNEFCESMACGVFL